MTSSAIPLFKVFMPPAAHAALQPVLASGRLATGPQVAQFETQLAAWLGTSRVVALSDSSAALTLALYCAGVRPGDEVIVSPLACAATLMPIANLFARPVWCDVDPLTGMPDANHVAAALTKNTRAILLYHWSGDVGDVAAISALAKQHGIKLIEDASEAFGAQLHDKRLGGIADFTVYSFYATKHINTGEGAALLAANADDLDAARRLRRFGIDTSTFRLPNGDLDSRADIAVAGFNFAMNEIAATLGIAALSHADDIVARKQDNGRYFDVALKDIPGLRLLERRVDAKSAYWTYSLLVERRDELIAKLGAQGILAQRLHLRSDGYACFGGRQADLPGVAEFDTKNVSIPCGWWLDTSARTRIADSLRAGW